MIVGRVGRDGGRQATALLASAALLAMVIAGGYPAAWAPAGFVATTFMGVAISAAVAAGAVVVAFVIGLPAGLLAGTGAGDLVLALARAGRSVPALFTGLVLAGSANVILGPAADGRVRGLAVAVALGLALWPKLAGAAAKVIGPGRQSRVMLMARAHGASGFRAGWRHLLPRALAAMCVSGFEVFGLAVLLEATIAHLGLGVPGSLGAVIKTQQDAFQPEAWWHLGLPCAVLVAMIFLAKLVESRLHGAGSAGTG